MEQIYNLLDTHTKSNSLLKLNYLVPKITLIVQSNNLINELTKYKLFSWNKERYNKKKIDQLSTNKFDMYTIAWLPEQLTSIHDHPSFGCILCVLSGILEEKLYDKKLNLIKTSIITAPHVSYIDNEIGFHSIKCIEKALTLHIYSPPNYRPFLMSVNDINNKL